MKVQQSTKAQQGTKTQEAIKEPINVSLEQTVDYQILLKQINVQPH